MPYVDHYKIEKRRYSKVPTDSTDKDIMSCNLESVLKDLQNNNFDSAERYIYESSRTTPLCNRNFKNCVSILERAIQQREETQYGTPKITNMITTIKESIIPSIINLEAADREISKFNEINRGKIYQELHESIENARICDRIIKNDASITKTFGIGEYLNENSHLDPVTLIYEFCKMVDSYDMSKKKKYYIALEEAAYRFPKAIPSISVGELVKHITEFFIFSPECSVKDRTDMAALLESNNIFTPDEKAFATYIYESDITDSADVVEILKRYDAKDENGIKKVLTKVFASSPKNILDDTPHILSWMRGLVIIGGGTLHPAIAGLMFMADRFVSMKLKRSEADKLYTHFHKELKKAERARDAGRTKDGKDDMDAYVASIEKCVDKIDSYRNGLYDDDELDRRNGLIESTKISFLERIMTTDYFATHHQNIINVYNTALFHTKNASIKAMSNDVSSIVLVDNKDEIYDSFVKLGRTKSVDVLLKYVDANSMISLPLEYITFGSELNRESNDTISAICGGIASHMGENFTVSFAELPETNSYVIYLIFTKPLLLSDAEDNIADKTVDDQLQEEFAKILLLGELVENAYPTFNAEEGIITENMVFDYVILFKNLPLIIKNLFVDASKTGNYKGIRPNLLKMVDKCKTESEIIALKKDAYAGISQLKHLKAILEKASNEIKRIDKLAGDGRSAKDTSDYKKYKDILNHFKNNTPAKIQDQIDWLKEVYLPAINKKHKEITGKSKINESFDEDAVTEAGVEQMMESLAEDLTHYDDNIDVQIETASIIDNVVSEAGIELSGIKDVAVLFETVSILNEADIITKASNAVNNAASDVVKGAIKAKNTTKLATTAAVDKVKTLSAKEKEMSRSMDLAITHIKKSIEDALVSDKRESIIKGSIVPSFSKIMKTAIITGAAWMINPALAVIGIVGGLAVSRKLTERERIYLLDEIEVELKAVEKEINTADSENDTVKYRNLLKYQRKLQREEHRIKYNLSMSGKDIPDPDEDK